MNSTVILKMSRQTKRKTIRAESSHTIGGKITKRLTGVTFAKREIDDYMKDTVGIDVAPGRHLIV